MHDDGPTTDPLVDPGTHAELARLVEELSWRIDHGLAARIWELFTVDGRMDAGPAPVIGADALLEWGVERDLRPGRTRHVASGMRFVRTGPDEAVGTTLVTQFAAPDDGVGKALPQAIGEDTDVFRRTADGWRFASRTFELLFRA